MKQRLIFFAIFSLLVLAVAPVAADQRIPTSSISAAPAGASDVIVDGGFEGSYNPDAFGFGVNDDWDHTSVVYGNGPGFFNDPGQGHNGSDWYAVLGATGGAGTNEVATISQTVTLGTDSAELSFWLGCNGGDGDTLEVRVDGNVEYTDTCPADQSWTEETVDLSAYADGGTHVLTFRGTDSVGGLTNWFIDDVALIDTVPLVAAAACNASEDLEVTITNGDGPFDIYNGVNLVHDDVPAGTYALAGPSVEAIVEETTGNMETRTWGIFDCTIPVDLSASAACVDGDVEVTITYGDGPFDIYENGVVVYDDVSVGVYTLAGPGTFTNVEVVETSGDTQSSGTLFDGDCQLPNVDLLTSASCDGADLEVVINAGDGPFDIYENGALVHDDVPTGTYIVDGANSYTAVVVEETTGDLEQANLGDFDCFVPVDLTATAQCQGVDLVVDIQTGNAPFNIFADSGPVPLSSVGLGQTVISGPAMWTNVRVDEVGMDYQSVDLGNFNCGVPTSTITIYKNAIPQDGTNFDFYGDLGPFTLDHAIPDDGDVYYQSMTFPVTPGTYSVSEEVPTGWNLRTIRCSDRTVVFTSNTVDIEIGDGEDIVCYFNNERLPGGTIEIFKVTDYPSDQVFPFDGDLGPFGLMGTESISFDDITAGDYSITEIVPEDWQLESIMCDTVDADDTSSINVGAGTVVVDLDPGEYFSCVFSNVWAPRPATVTIYKAGMPVDDTVFNFDGTFGPFTLMPDQDQTFDVDFPTPGAVNVQVDELPPPDGWLLLDVFCGEGGAEPQRIPEKRVNLDVMPGDEWVCNFLNGRLGKLTIVKEAEPGDTGQAFDFSIFEPGFGPIDDISLMDGESASYTFGPFTINVTESVPSGWELVDIVCDGGDVTYYDDGFDINMMWGDDVTCTFYNEKLPEPGSVTIIKDATPSYPDFDFDFTGDLGNFALAGGESITFDDVAPGFYDVYETIPDGWYIDDIVCNDGLLPNGALGHLALEVESGDAIVCTVYNVQYGGITIYKDMDPFYPGFLFDFTGDLGDFSLGGGDFYSANDLEPGTYTVSEVVPAGWFLEEIVCDVAVGSPADGGYGVNIDVQPGQFVVCTFYNVQGAYVTIEKQTTPDGALDVFDFSGDLGDFSLSDGQSQSFGPIYPGMLTVTESGPDGWLLDSVDCFGILADMPPAELGSIQIPALPGSSTTCTFNNRQTSSITIAKDAVVEDGTVFDFTSDLGAFSLMVGDTVTFSDLDPGDYTFTETVPDGWTLGTIMCPGYPMTRDGNSMTVTLGAGENIQCGFINLKYSHITIVKEANPADGTSFDFRLEEVGVGIMDDFSLMDGESMTYELLPGEFIASELNVPDGWDVTNIECDDDNSTAKVNGAVINLDWDEHVTCTFTNEGSYDLIVNKWADPADGTDFEFSLTGYPNFSLMDGESEYFFGLTAGEDYVITELVPDGWMVDRAVCGETVYTGPSVTLNFAPGQDIECDFYNVVDEGTGLITIVKEADPADGTDFEFTGPEGLFLLDDADPDDGDAVPNSMTFELPPGLYSFSEVVPDGWTQTRISCDFEDIQPSAGFSFGLSVYLNADQHITCTFHNEQPAPAEQFGPGQGDAPQRNDPSQPKPADDVLYGVDLLAWLNN